MNNDKNPGLFHNALKGLPYSALSWNGMNLFGDTPSIKEAASALHALHIEPELRRLLQEAVSKRSPTDARLRETLREECRNMAYAREAIMSPSVYGKWEWIEACLKAMRRIAEGKY